MSKAIEFKEAINPHTVLIGDVRAFGIDEDEPSTQDPWAYLSVFISGGKIKLRYPLAKSTTRNEDYNKLKKLYCAHNNLELS